MPYDAASLDLQSIADVKEKDNEFFVWRVASVFAHASQIVMEYCGGGSVSDLLSVCKRGLNEDQIALIVRDTLEALQHLHAKNMIHRDLKAGSASMTFCTYECS